MALDIEGNDPPSQWMLTNSTTPREFVCAWCIGGTGPYFPVLYTNGKTAQYIADNRYKYRLLGHAATLWKYARFKRD